VPDGGTVQFECHVEGNPRPQITWFRQTAIIKPSQDFQVSKNLSFDTNLFFKLIYIFLFYQNLLISDIL